MPLRLSRSSYILMFAGALSLQAQTATKTHPKTTTTPGKTHTAARTTTHTPASTAPDGTKAIGEMPAVTGVPKPLFALQYVDVTIGTGELAQPHKFYTVQYTGWTMDGKKFDSSYDHGAPFVFPAGARRVITGWDTGFEGMRIGGKRRLVVPYQLAYGEMGHPPEIPAKATLVFDVEFLGQSDTPPPPVAVPTPPQQPADTAPQK